MKTFSQRQKILGGVFLIVGVAWSMDMLTGGPQPAPAGAVPTLTLEVMPMPPEPQELEALIDGIMQPPPAREALPFEFATRDVFQPSAAMPIVGDGGLGSAIEGESEEARENAQVAFDSQHQLQGIIAGRVPLALIDGQLVGVGVVIDGHRLTEIQRDEVIFELDGRRISLPLAPIGQTAPPK